jgi:hypothetical protein
MTMFKFNLPQTKPPTSYWGTGSVGQYGFFGVAKPPESDTTNEILARFPSKGGTKLGEAPLKKDESGAISSDGYRLQTGAPKSMGMSDSIDGKVVNTVDSPSGPSGPTGPNYLMLVAIAAAVFFIYKRFKL